MLNSIGETPLDRLKNTKSCISDLIHLGVRHGATAALTSLQDSIDQDSLSSGRHQSRPLSLEEQSLSISLVVDIEDIIKEYSVAVDCSQEKLDKEIYVFGGRL